MPDVDAILRLQALLADALLHADPVAFVHEQCKAPGADPSLAHIDPDGLRMAALLVTKLRFQRLINGSRPAGEWFTRDARGFTAAFREYHGAVPPVALDPWREAAAFAEWCEARGYEL